VTEVPEHLLRRARERRAAAAGGTADGDSPAPSTAVEASAAAAPAASGGEVAASGGGGRAPAEAAYTGPAPLPPRKQRVPMWAMPVLLFLPLWAVLYGGAFGERKVAAVGPVAEGQGVYRTAGCSGCHGPTGGGGVGPALDGVLKTFPNFADHVAWVESGSAAVKGKTYGSGSRVATGGMPSFKGALSKEQIIAVVCHERVDYGGANPPPPECAADAGAAAGK